MVVTFCGHSEVSHMEEVRFWLLETLEQLIAEGAETFYLGGYGAFDLLAASVIWQLKGRYPEIRSILVLPYPDRKVNCTRYDGTVYPPMENVPKRFAITHRNRWMADRSDVVLAYVLHRWGGAAAMLGYAERRGKRVIRFLPE